MLPGLAFVALSALAAKQWMSRCGQLPPPPCLLISDRCIESSNEQASEKVDQVLKHAVIVDFGKRMIAWKDRVKCYRDLSPTSDAESAVRFINSLIEWAQQVPGAVLVFFPADIQDESNFSDGFVTTIQQRFRAETGGLKPVDNLLDISIEFPPPVEDPLTMIASASFKLRKRGDDSAG